MNEAGKNLGKPPQRVRWADLERSSEDSAFRSNCPACGNGILLVARCSCLEHFVCFDRCTTCGQIFVYEDREICGTPVLGASEIQVHEVMEK